MKEFNISKGYAPYITLALKKLGITDYTLEHQQERCVVRADISNRSYKVLLRNAWAAKMSDEKGVRHLTREDIGTPKTGVIPKSEAAYFEYAYL